MRTTTNAVTILKRRYRRGDNMKLAVRRATNNDVRMGVKAGDILLVDLNYEWDPEKVEVLSVLKRGSSPEMSQYKEALTRVSAQELRDYLGV